MMHVMALSKNELIVSYYLI